MPSEMAETMKIDSEVAIVGFWKQNAKKEFTCYHYFYIPCPQTRDTSKSDRMERGKAVTVTVRQLLYHGHNDNIFLFYEEPKTE